MQYRLALVILFCISIFIRLPYLNNPLSGNFQWMTAHSLITFDIWKQEGITQHYFLPVYTYPDSLNYHIPIGDLGSVEKNGRFYYISYPAFGFIFPYLATLGLAYNPLVLKSFNILMHFISAIILWKILVAFFTPIASLLCIAYFLFQPNLLWFHSNVYFLDILSMDLFILQLYISHKYLQNPNQRNGLCWLLVNTLLCQTEWIGYLVLFTVGTFATYHKKWKLLWIVTIWGILNLGFTFWHYGSFLGYEDYLNALTQKGLKRIGNSEALSHRWGEWKPLLFFIINFMIYEFTLILALFFNLGNTLSFWDQLQNNIKMKPYLKLTILAGLPVFLHYLILFNFTTGHTAFASVIATPFLILLIAPTLEIMTQIPNSLAKKMGIFLNVMIVLSGILFFLLRNNLDFQWYFKIHFANFQFTPNTEFQELGQKIQSQTPHDYVAGLLNPYCVINPQIIFYAKRNIVQFFSYQEAVEYAQKHQVKLKVYEINSYWQVINIHEVLPKKVNKE